MKKIRFLTALILMFSLLTVSALAADFIPSAERQDGPELVGKDDSTGKIVVGTIYNADGTVYRDVYLEELIITSVWHLSDDVDEAIKSTLLDAKNELESKTWSEILADFGAQWKAVTNGAPVDNAIISDIFDVRLIDSLSGELISGRKLTFTIKAQGIDADTLFLLIHKPTGANGWKVENKTIDGQSVITITVESLSPFAVIKDTGAAPAVTPDAPDSPQTGVEARSYVLPVIGLVLIAGAAVVVTKKVRNAA